MSNKISAREKYKLKQKRERKLIQKERLLEFNFKLSTRTIGALSRHRIHKLSQLVDLSQGRSVEVLIGSDWSFNEGNKLILEKFNSIEQLKNLKGIGDLAFKEICDAVNTPFPKPSWVLLGHAGVDSGCLMVVDPCYVLKHEQDKDSGASITYDELFGDDFFDKLPCAQEGIVKGRGGNVTVFKTFDGDGNYPIYGLLDKHGRIRRVTVDLDFTLTNKYFSGKE